MMDTYIRVAYNAWYRLADDADITIEQAFEAGYEAGYVQAQEDLY
jgi:hypothetical protein